MDIYADVLFIINLIINSLLLCTTAIISKKQIYRLRLFLSALTGALTATVIFYLDLSLLINVIISIPVCFVMIKICFKIKYLIQNLKITGMYLLFSLVFFAICDLAASITALPVYTSGGIVYFNIHSMFLLSLTVLGFALSFIFAKTNDFNKDNSLFSRLIITYQGTSINVTAFNDTGNNITDFFTNLPVIILEKKYAQQLIGEDVDYNSITYGNSIPVKLKKNMRFIPYSGIWSRENMLICFKVDDITVVSSQKKIYKPSALIGVSEMNLSVTREYSALINPTILKQ